MPISAQVVSTLTCLMDSLAILLSGSALYGLFVFYSTEANSIYVSAICFIWICTILLFQFAGIYTFEAILSPFAYVDKLAIGLITSFLFLLAVAFSVKI